MNVNYISTSSFSAGLIPTPRSYILLGLDLSPSDLYGSLNILIIRIFLGEPPKFIKAVFCHAKAFPAPAGPSLKHFSLLQRSVSVLRGAVVIIRTRLAIEFHARRMPIVVERSIACLACSSADNILIASFYCTRKASLSNFTV